MRALPLFLLAFSFSSLLSAANPTTPRLPNQEAIAKALEQMKPADRPLDEQEQKLADIYQKTLNLLKQAIQEQDQLEALQHQITGAPADMEKLQDNLDKTNRPSDKSLLEKYRHLPVDQLRKLLDARLEEINEQQNLLTRMASQITIARARPETNQAIISKNVERLKDITAQLNLLESTTAATDHKDQQRNLLQAEANVLQTQDSRLNLEIRDSSTLLDLETLKQRLVLKKAQLLEQEVLSIQTIINFKRRAASEQAVATASRINRSSVGKAALLQAEAAENMELSQQLLTTSDRISQSSAKGNKVRSQLNNLDNITLSIRQQSALIGENRILARMLRENLMSLPSITIDHGVEELITQTRLQKFKYDQQRQVLTSPENKVQELISRQTVKYTQQDHDELLRLLTDRQTLLEDLSSELGILLTTATSLDLDQKALASHSNELSNKLEERLFWIASNQPLGLNWLVQLPQALWQQLLAIPWEEILFSFTDTLRDKWFVSMLVVAFCLFLQARRRKFVALQRTLTRKMGNVRHDTLLITPTALGLALLQVMPLPILMGAIGVALVKVTGNPDGVSNLGMALIVTAVAWLLLSLAIQILRPHNIAVTHFHWPPQRCRKVQHLLLKLKMVMVPLLLTVTLAKSQPTDLNQDILGMTLLMAGSLFQGWILFQIMRGASSLFGSRFLHVLLTLALVLIALAQLVLTAAGYYYTTLQLQEQLAGTLYLVGAAVLLQALVIRSLRVAERRLSFTRALKKRAASKDGENIEEPTLDIATVNQQSLRLLNALMIVGLFIGLYWLWREVFSLLNVLNNIILWEFAPELEGGEIFQVHLTDLLLSVTTLVTSFILARNLPGLLEVTVLSRLKLRAGSSYAATTLLSYTISCVGFITALSLLGASWAKLQWLIAALGIGIGIGLQEIVANFVAGLIILFERPIRIGDTITLGDTNSEINGVITRIRIRATTVTDWDHKEIIIPNKMLMGEKLINWSLSNSVVRIILPFYVSHDADPQLVHKLLHQAAKDHERVVDTPETLVLLMEYGDSALQYELRTHVAHVDDRLQVRDQLNEKILELFRENGVSIAYPKQDVFLRNMGAGHA
ncbi:mechanosensitive ion channel [Sansalvadorimonas sp. 2012CJ34-2]|uniref:Mechanosensitive ion channel n=1 Tax=Parendozoicomonas callyspongiae TaxID=2942213 RepID=A0ABT0PL82_9GAMM|nr:mechanosensitive ion channel domain-containing protein [Sansalvadorimonas sp. 2012CJ34-2]MCL6271198.1 mechanosensitive ion channel [Sansalvadorimonas sp. 2012CJ34-2]